MGEAYLAGKITALQAALQIPLLFIVGFRTKTTVLNPTYISTPSRLPQIPKYLGEMKLDGQETRHTFLHYLTGRTNPHQCIS